VDLKKVYEKQYIEKSLRRNHNASLWQSQNFLKKFHLDRYSITEKLIEPGERVLDIGCGEGDILIKLEDKFTELYAIDITPISLQEAMKKVKNIEKISSKFKFIERDVNKSLPFQDNFFDGVLCLAVIEHIYDVFSLIKEIYRVTKRGGYVIAEVPNICYLKYRIKFLTGELPKTTALTNWKEFGWDCGHIHYFTMKTFCWLFEEEGFIIEKKTGSGSLAKFRNWWPSLLTGDLLIKARKTK